MRIIYPEIRNITDEQISSWYADAVVNKECEDLDAIRHSTITIREMAEALHNAGLITLGKE